MMEAEIWPRKLGTIFEGHSLELFATRKTRCKKLNFWTNLRDLHHDDHDQLQDLDETSGHRSVQNCVVNCC